MQEPLRSQLQQLQSHLSRLQPGNDQATAAARNADTTIRTMLDEPGSDITEHHRSLREQLKDVLLHVEASHPTLAAAIENVIDTLANIGV